MITNKRSSLNGRSLIWLLLFVAILLGCRKDDPVVNQNPETQLVLESINLSGDNRLNSLVNLKWWGIDPDGVVVGYEISLDNLEWSLTTLVDSTFLFSIPEGEDTTDIDFWVRAIDDDGAMDETPAYLSIPLKNTPPEIAFKEDLLPTDSVFNVLTLQWEVSDLDGFENLKSVEIKINEGEWQSLSPLWKIASIVPSDPKGNGAMNAPSYFDISTEGPVFDDLRLNDLNDVFIRATDIAGAISTEDTLQSVYFKGVEHDVLLLGASAKGGSDIYRNNLTTAGLSFDYLNFYQNDFNALPKIWSPTLELMLSQYKSVMIYTNEFEFLNAQTSSEDIFLEFAAPALQYYLEEGGQLFISANFPKQYQTASGLFGILPIESLVDSDEDARLKTDSIAEAFEAGYPDLVCSLSIVGLDPLNPSSNATPLYLAHTFENEWTGSELVAVKSGNGVNTNIVFIGMELQQMNGDSVALQNLFKKVFNDEFNW